MDTYIWIYILVGLLVLAIPWLKRFEKYQILNVPLFALLLGMIFYSLPINLPDPDPIKYEFEILKLTELVVIISLMGAGLKIDKDFSFKGYRVPLLLVGITMILSIASVILMGWWVGLVPASAVLLGAVFAPTDPVLASEIQVKIEEKEEEEHPINFSLTAEAGLNDGMAFPFTWLAVAVAMYGLNYGEWLGTWIWKDVLYRIGGGIVIGYVMGKVMAWTFFELPRKIKFTPKRLGFLAVAITLFVYGITEAAHAHGFIAVFVAALTMRHYEKQHKFHQEMHDVIEQTELFLTVVILFLLGGYVVQKWFGTLPLSMMGICLAFIFILRPLFGILATLGTDMPWKHRWIVAFLGIRGIGSFFYLAFALHQTEFEQKELLWSAVAFLVFVSAIVHRLVGYYVKKKVV